jgi:hypothetical protein
MDRARANSLSARGMFSPAASAVHRAGRDVHALAFFAERALKKRGLACRKGVGHAVDRGPTRKETE